MKKISYSLLFLFVAGAFFSSCKKDEKTDPIKEPTYTTVSLKFTNNANASDVQTITYKDMDGNGPLLPTFSTLKLKPNSAYSVVVLEVKDENTNPSTDLLSIIKRDSKNYLFVYDVFQANLGFSVSNYDSENNFFGTEARSNTGIASNGNFIFKLVKNPLSKAKPDSAGDIKFEYTFPVVIQ
jgi:hypothetical protein